MAPDDYRALHPAGTAPVITDGDLVLAETGAIIEYIIAKYGNGKLQLSLDDKGFTDYLFWFHFCNASFMTRGLMEMMGRAIAQSEAIGMLEKRSEYAYTMVENRLGEAAFFAGDDFTAADIMMVFPLTTMRLFNPRDISGYPKILSYLQSIGERPGCQRAMQKAEPNLRLQLS